MKFTVMKQMLLVLALGLFSYLPSLNGAVKSPFENDTKVFTYWSTCNCYMLTLDDGTNDGCEWFVNGEDLWNNGHCH